MSGPRGPREPLGPDHPHDDLAAYALGALEPADEAAVEAHLAVCGECRAEVDELGGLTARLSLLDLDDLTPAPVELLERTVALARAEPTAPAAVTRAQRRPPRRLLAAAAAVVLLGGVGAGVYAALPHHDTAVTSTARGPVRMVVETSAAGDDTALTVRVAGLPDHQRCRLVAIAADGTRHAAGRWTATYDGQATVSEVTHVPRDELRSLVLFTADGHHLATVQV